MLTTTTTMESLQLPKDILWDGDQSPSLSPAQFSNASEEEILIFDDSSATGKYGFCFVSIRRMDKIDSVFVAKIRSEETS